MGRMVETSIKSFKGNFPDIFVTLQTVPFYRKGGVAIMTGTAGQAVLHFPHGARSPIWSCHKQFTMAVPAVERHVRMKLVTERGITGQYKLRRLMTSDAITFYGKSGRPIMTSATPFTTLHLSHAEMGIIVDGPEEFIMAVGTGIHSEVFTMTEDQIPEIRNFNGDITSRMTFGAVVEFYSVSVARIGMASAARLSLLHVCHGVHRIFFAHYVENGIVAG